MTLDEALEANRAQEMEILRLRAEKGEQAARIANLTRMHDNAQRHIGRLQAALNKTARHSAEAVFGGGK